MLFISNFYKDCRVSFGSSRELSLEAELIAIDTNKDVVIRRRRIGVTGLN